MEDATITVTIAVGTRWGRDDVTRDISITCDEPDALVASALNIGDAVKHATYAAVREYLDNLKGAEAEQAEATNE